MAHLSEKIKYALFHMHGDKIIHSIVADGIKLSSVEDQAEALEDDYETLATPQDDPSFDQDYYDEILRDNTWLYYIITGSNDGNPVTADEVMCALKALHKNKAADSDSLMAEHLINAKSDVVPALTHLLNAVRIHKYIPETLKSGYIFSMPKKGKDPKNPAGHRGITITSVLSKILEAVFKNRHEETALPMQENLQFGFTQGYSPLMATLVVTEAIGEAKRLNRILNIVSVDVRKAFDVVDRPILLHTLFEENCDIETIGMTKELYTGLHNRVLWQGYPSRDFQVGQGVRQGGCNR